MEIELPRNFGQGKLPSRVELALFLIKAELKNRKFTAGLEQLGFDTSFYSFDFSSLILKLAGFEVRSDEIYEWYHKQLEAYISKVEFKDELGKLNEHAFNFYMDIEMERRNRLHEMIEPTGEERKQENDAAHQL